MKHNSSHGANPQRAAQLVTATGRLVLAVFVLAILGAVLTRQLQLPGILMLSDIQHYALSALVYTGIVSAWLSNGHIRSGFTNNAEGGLANRARLEIAWIVICVILPMGVILTVAMPDIFASWKILEGSSQQDGLPGLFLVKTILPFFCAAMIVLAAARIWRLSSRAT